MCVFHICGLWTKTGAVRNRWNPPHWKAQAGFKPRTFYTNFFYTKYHRCPLNDIWYGLKLWIVCINQYITQFPRYLNLPKCYMNENNSVIIPKAWTSNKTWKDPPLRHKHSFCAYDRKQVAFCARGCPAQLVRWLKYARAGAFKHSACSTFDTL